MTIKIEQTLENSSEGEDNALVYSCYNKIYLHRKDSKDILIDKRENTVTSLSNYNGRLFHTEVGGAYDTLSKKPVFSDKFHIFWSLQVHSGVLLSSEVFKNPENGAISKRIVELLSRKLVYEGKTSMLSMASYKGELYFLEDNKVLRVKGATEGEVVAERKGLLFALCATPDALLCGGDDKTVFDIFGNKVLAEREGTIEAITSLGDIVIDGGQYKNIYNTFENHPLFTEGSGILNFFKKTHKKNVFNLCTIDSCLVQELL